jgi:hypothetical protein
MQIKKTIRICSVLVVVVVLCNSWGFLVHRTIHQLAIYELRGPLQHFFYRNMELVVKYSVRADQRRNEDSTEGPKHFIDLEVFGDSARKMPLTWNEAVHIYGKDSLMEYGYVPYYIMTMKDRLTNAFRNGLKDSVLFYAIDLGHYISDAHVPLHTSVNYDGQLTNQKGLHSLWETVVPELELAEYDLHSGHKARYLNHPEKEVWKAVRQAHKLVKDVFQQELIVTSLFSDSSKYRVQIRNGKEYRTYTSVFAKTYSEHLGSTINRQLRRSADLTADFWYTCWVDAGRPDVNSWMQPAFSETEKAALEAQLKAYKKNTLIIDSLLIARKNVGRD